MTGVLTMEIPVLEYILKFIAGGSIVVLVSYLAEKGNAVLAGILLAAPITTVISSCIVGNESGRNALIGTIKSDILFLPLMFVYLIPLYLLLKKMHLNVNVSIVLALVIWTIMSFAFFRVRGIFGL
ncbi:MAG: GlpM family protein [bacterium]